MPAQASVLSYPPTQYSHVCSPYLHAGHTQRAALSDLDVNQMQHADPAQHEYEAHDHPAQRTASETSCWEGAHHALLPQQPSQHNQHHAAGRRTSIMHHSAGSFSGLGHRMQASPVLVPALTPEQQFVSMEGAGSGWASRQQAFSNCTHHSLPATGLTPGMVWGEHAQLLPMQCLSAETWLPRALPEDQQASYSTGRPCSDAASAGDSDCDELGDSEAYGARAVVAEASQAPAVPPFAAPCAGAARGTPPMGSWRPGRQLSNQRCTSTLFDRIVSV